MPKVLDNDWLKLNGSSKNICILTIGKEQSIFLGLVKVCSLRHLSMLMVCKQKGSMCR